MKGEKDYTLNQQHIQATNPSTRSLVALVSYRKKEQMNPTRLHRNVMAQAEEKKGTINFMDESKNRHAHPWRASYIPTSDTQYYRNVDNHTLSVPAAPAIPVAPADLGAFGNGIAAVKEQEYIGYMTLGRMNVMKW